MKLIAITNAHLRKELKWQKFCAFYSYSIGRNCFNRNSKFTLIHQCIGCVLLMTSEFDLSNSIQQSVNLSFIFMDEQAFGC